MFSSVNIMSIDKIKFSKFISNWSHCLVKETKKMLRNVKEKVTKAKRKKTIK